MSKHFTSRMVRTEMFISISHLLSLVLFLCVLGPAFLGAIIPTSCTSNLTFRCSQMEKNALLSFKEGLTDLSGRLSSWVGEDCCSWIGVGCDKTTSHVVELDLRNRFQFSDDSYENRQNYQKSCLGGKISPSLLNLKYLSYLDLSQNNFEGINIPNFLGSLESLNYLNLSFPLFTGVIPPHLGNLSKLQYLDLNSSLVPFSEFSLVGRLEVKSLQWFVGLPSLKYLDMSLVSIREVKPDWLQAVNMLPSLLELDLRGCGLVTLPQSISSINFTSLTDIL